MYFFYSRHTDVNFSPENTYLDMYHNQNEQYFPNNLTDEMFQNVQDTNSMLLHSVDTTNELNNLSQIQVSHMSHFSSIKCNLIFFNLIFIFFFCTRVQIFKK